jgi:S-DNA-T family DNA segregation ATPase FtsK/SpoIIIE
MSQSLTQQPAVDWQTRQQSLHIRPVIAPEPQAMPAQPQEQWQQPYQPEPEYAPQPYAEYEAPVSQPYQECASCG